VELELAIHFIPQAAEVVRAALVKQIAVVSPVLVV
jgi:hypothetical protein